jgi:hypothetical protein
MFLLADAVTTPVVSPLPLTPTQIDWLTFVFKDAPMTGFFIWFMLKGFPQLIDLAKWVHSMLVAATLETERKYQLLVADNRADRIEDRKLRDEQAEIISNLRLEIQELNHHVTSLKSALSISSSVLPDEKQIFRSGTTVPAAQNQ